MHALKPELPTQRYLSAAVTQLGGELGQLALVAARHRAPGVPARSFIQALCRQPWFTEHQPRPQRVAIVASEFNQFRDRLMACQQQMGVNLVLTYDTHDVVFVQPSFGQVALDLVLLLNVMNSFDAATAPLSLINLMTALDIGGRLIVCDPRLQSSTLGLDSQALSGLGISLASWCISEGSIEGDWFHVLTRTRASARLTAIAPDLANSLSQYAEVAGEY